MQLRPLVLSAAVIALSISVPVGLSIAARRGPQPAGHGTAAAPPPATAPSTGRAGGPEESADAWHRLANEDGAACRGELKKLGVVFRALPDRTEPLAGGCGIPHGVLVSRGPTGIRYVPPLQIDCTFARTLPSVEAAVQKVGERELSARIVRIANFGSYACRPVRNGFSGRLSEHAVGDAVDLARFDRARGKPILVGRDYRPDEEPVTAESRFLRGLIQELRASSAVTHVIGPEDRADHHDHFHLDNGPHWHWWWFLN